MGSKPEILVTGVSGNLGQRLVEELPDFDVIGIDLHEPRNSGKLAVFKSVDLGDERSCEQLLGLMRTYRPEGVAHLAFVIDPMRTGVLDDRRMWLINVAGTGRVMEAIAEYNRSLGGINKFVFPSSVSAYGSDLAKPVAEDAPLEAHTLPYALHKRETDLAVQARARSLKCRTYILRPHIFAGATVENYLLGVLRGNPGGQGWLARKLRERKTRLPLVLPWGRKYLEHRLQFVHVDDVARLMAYILRRLPADPPLNIFNVAGRGDALTIRDCIRLAGAKIRRLPGRVWCRILLQALWNLGISDIPPEALPYMIGSYTMDTTRLRAFLGNEYRNVIRYTCAEALKDSFSRSNQQSAVSIQP